MRKIDTVILGAGLSGLSIAARLGDVLPDEEIVIFEKSQLVGGLCRSVTKDGFTYDYSGHLLHLRKDETRRWVFELLKNNLIKVRRDSRIFSQNTLTRYPYQMNLYGLPLKTIKDCLSGLIMAHLKGDLPRSDISFLDWSKKTFGNGITKYFMKPYNEKLFRMSSQKFTALWCGDFVPRPSIEETFLGAISDNLEQQIGYNATFFYPKINGIQSLINSLYNQARKHSFIELGIKPLKVDLSSRIIQLSDGREVKYRRLISTIPLKKFASLSGMQKLAAGLMATDVVCFNIGVKGEADHKIHWIYFPEKKFNFYRVGFYSNINPLMAPEGFYSMYVEVSIPHNQKEKKNLYSMLDEVISGLKSADLLSSPSDIVSLDIRYMPGAYVVYDFKRTGILNKIRYNLQKAGDVYLSGRYGEWKYSYMEESLYNAMKISEEISMRSKIK